MFTLTLTRHRAIKSRSFKSVVAKVFQTGNRARLGPIPPVRAKPTIASLPFSKSGPWVKDAGLISSSPIVATEIFVFRDGLEMWRNNRFLRITSVAILALLILTLALACGTSAPVEDNNAAPIPPVTAAVSSSETQNVPSSGETGAVQPTAVPAAVPETEPESNQGTITLMLNDFGAERFDTHLTTGGVEYLRAIHGLLIAEDAFDGTLKLGPGIATKWEISSDFLTWTVTIRDGVRFHDGSELTIDDVVWSLQHGIGPGAYEYVTGNSSITLSRSMEIIEKTGPNQVSLTTMEPSVEIPSRISEGTRGGLIGAIMPRRDTLHDFDEELAFDSNPIGAGPMSFVEHISAESMTLERFADFYYQPDNGFSGDKRMKFKELDLRLVPEEAARVAALRSGDGDIGLISLDTKDQVESGGGRVVFGPEGVAISVRFIGCWDPAIAPTTINDIEIPRENYPCIDKRVRQALAYALPKEAIQNNLYGSPDVWEIKGWTRVTPSAIGYSPELDPFHYDPDKARELLAEAGYPGGEGFPPLVINTWPNNAVPFLVETALQGASSWEQELGLDVEVKVSDGAISSKVLFGTTDFFGQIVWRDDRPRLDPASLLKSRYGTRESFSQTHQDAELYALSEQGLSAFDPATREGVLRDIYRRLKDEAHFISFGYLNIPWGAGPRILTWEPNPLSNFPSALHTIELAE